MFGSTRRKLCHFPGMTALLTHAFAPLFLVSRLIPSSSRRLCNCPKRDRNVIHQEVAAHDAIHQEVAAHDAIHQEVAAHDAIHQEVAAHVLYWMKTQCACFPNVLAMSGVTICTTTAPSKTTEVTVGASNWASATLSGHTFATWL